MTKCYISHLLYLWIPYYLPFNHTFSMSLIKKFNNIKQSIINCHNRENWSWPLTSWSCLTTSPSRRMGWGSSPSCSSYRMKRYSTKERKGSLLCVSRVFVLFQNQMLYWYLIMKSKITCKVINSTQGLHGVRQPGGLWANGGWPLPLHVGSEPLPHR